MVMFQSSPLSSELSFITLNPLLFEFVSVVYVIYPYADPHWQQWRSAGNIGFRCVNFWLSWWQAEWWTQWCWIFRDIQHIICDAGHLFHWNSTIWQCLEMTIELQYHDLPRVLAQNRFDCIDLAVTCTQLIILVASKQTADAGNITIPSRIHCI